MKVFLVYPDGALIDKEIRVYHNRNSANSYRWRKQKEERYDTWKIRKVTLI